MKDYVSVDAVTFDEAVTSEETRKMILDCERSMVI
jgi:hypothetical protein